MMRLLLKFTVGFPLYLIMLFAMFLVLFLQYIFEDTERTEEVRGVISDINGMYWSLKGGK